MDYFILINKKGNNYEGYLYADTDLFVDTREGYIPAYFVKPMKNLTFDTLHGKISFEINLTNDDFLRGENHTPIPLTIRSTEEAQKQGYKT